MLTYTIICYDFIFLGFIVVIERIWILKLDYTMCDWFCAMMIIWWKTKSFLKLTSFTIEHINLLRFAYVINNLGNELYNNNLYVNWIHWIDRNSMCCPSSSLKVMKYKINKIKTPDEFHCYYYYIKTIFIFDSSVRLWQKHKFIKTSSKLIPFYLIISRLLLIWERKSNNYLNFLQLIIDNTLLLFYCTFQFFVSFKQRFT